MSLTWKAAVEVEGAAKPLPTHAQNIASTMRTRHEGLGWSGAKHFHEMTLDEFGANPQTMWHGSPAGVDGLNHVAHYGLHVGTREAAKQALEARIGRPAQGEWDGTREYSKTLLTNHGHGYGYGAPKEDHYPTGRATYSGGTPIPMNAKPHLFPVGIVGEMTNSRHDPHEDFRANGLMAGQIKRGTARRGYYYENVGEDSGSISAVVPGRAHLATHEDFVRHAHANGDMGRPIHPENLERYGLS